jgi:hypothetical protein
LLNRAGELSLPTHEELTRFLREWGKLGRDRQELFLGAIDEMVEDLRARAGFRAGLRVKAVQGHPGIFEMTWAADGRATFSYGPHERTGEEHIIW